MKLIAGSVAVLAIGLLILYWNAGAVKESRRQVEHEAEASRQAVAPEEGPRVRREREDAERRRAEEAEKATLSAAATAAPAGDSSIGGRVGGGLFVLAFWMIAVGLAFLPTLIAALRHHPSVGGIFVVNLFLGMFCGLGWVIALAWACSATHVNVAIIRQPPAAWPAAGGGRNDTTADLRQALRR